MYDPRNESPFNALPPAVVALAFVIAAVEVLFQFGAAGLAGAEGGAWRGAAVRDWSVFPPVLEWMVANRSVPWDFAARFVTYPFIHFGLIHAGFVAVFVLALGNAVAPVFPGWRPVAFFVLPAVAGGLVYAAAFPGAGPLIGGYPGAYGLIGAFTLLTRRGLTRVPPDRAFLLIGLLLAIQPIFGLAAGAGFAWFPDFVAEVVGAAAGYGLAAAMFPGAARRFRDRMRRR
ncbi:rhomboid family intramembrane serine protease [Jannaschia sp. LMIT008]|uniref:rhomboid family intramembrane serine protease n=1 Tax=Jannaschia maritima TaxID=3032585 RepID=UPI002810CB06|nr:rhomboid family intramembrane serine protease [Jannaschia sp. LMIT008]